MNESHEFSHSFNQASVYMNINDLLSRCVRNGISLAANNGELRAHFNGEIQDRELLPLLRQYKQEILQHLAHLKPTSVQSIPVLPAKARTKSPASTAQRRMWLLDRLEGAGAAYNMVGAYRLRGVFDAKAMHAALNAVVARHEALRTIFADVDGDVHQIIQTAASVSFDYLDLSGSAADQKDQQLQRLLERENNWHFDLAAGPLLRATCIDVGDGSWVLVLNVHHIACDGWSIDILERDISALYATFATGNSVTLPPPAVQYVDYVAWSKQHIDDAMLQKQVDYWKTTLEGIPSLHSLPLDKPRPPIQVYAGATVRRAMPMPWLETVQARCHASGVTLFMYLHAALATVLGIYANEKDIVVGFPVAGRRHKELESTVGLFVNTLVLRTRLEENMSFSDVLAASRRTVIEALEHQDVPFDVLVDALRPDRSPAYNPLTQILLTLQTHARDGLRLPGLDSEPTDDPDAPVKFDLEIQAFQSKDGLVIDWRFNRSLFDDASMARMADSLMRLLDATAHESDRPLSHVNLLAPEERQLLLETWNQTEAPYPSERCIHHLFEAQVQRDPDAIAVVLQNHALTYRELNNQANRLAHYLIDQGVRPDDRVAICVERSFAMVVGLLAIFKAGGAYVPLDSAYPSARLGQILADADPAILLVDIAGRAALGEDSMRNRCALDLDSSHPAWVDCLHSNPHPAGLTSRHLAYVIYTSGSTGAPKGAQNEHHALVNRLVWMQKAYRLDASDVIIQKTPFGFDVSVWEFFWTLLNGATLALVPPNAHKDPAALIELIMRHRVTTAHFVPSMLAIFLQTEGVERCTTLRRLICSGEALPGGSVRRAQQRIPWISIYNLYGPTEAAIDVTSWACPEAFAEDVVPIGRPIANTQIYLLNGDGQLVPLGAVGELYIGGVGVARGYLNRPELTVERFLPDPFSTDPHSRMYRTGDLARYRPDGNIEFLGRIDHQVKLRGFRIELGEIEARVAEHPAVRDAVVLALGDDDLKRLVAYVVPVSGEAEDLAVSLRPYLARILPDYMVPAAFVILDALPLTPNGKLDRHALPSPSDDAFTRHVYEAPQGEIEITLATLWQELLKVERVGRHDHFFELGGHSLLAVRLLSRLAATFTIELPLVELFAHPTVSALAAVIVQYQATHTGLLIPITPTSRDGALPLSFAQQRLWFLAQIEGVSATYHIPAALRLHGTLDTHALRRAFDALFTRHEALRTVFVAVEGQPHVELLPAHQSFPLVEYDLQGHADPSAALAQLSREEALAPFDLTRGPLIRARLLRLAESDHVLLITQHHIVSDGWSLGVLVNELSALYGAFTRGQSDPLTPLAIQYPDYAAWQRQWFTEEQLAGQLDFWHRSLADAPVLLDVPTDRPRSASPSYVGASVPIQVDADLTRALKQLSQQHGTTLFMTLTAAWAAVLARLSGQNDLVIGTPSANRGRREIEPLVGFFVNTLALRIDLSGDPSVATLLERVRTVALAAQDHQDVPFEQVVERVNPPRRLEHTPLFQVLFAWQNNDRSTFDFPALQVEVAPVAFDRIKFDLELHLGELGNFIQGNLSYATDLFDASTIERHRGYLLTLLKAMVEHVDQPIARINVLAPEERTLLLDTWNQTDTSYPADHCIHQLFEAQVQRDPTATALVFEDRSLSYGELNTQANRLAHYLIEQGVRPDDRIAICVERSFSMITGLLAILKAGGAYVPLDPAYPAARLVQVLADAHPAIVLSDASGRAVLGEELLRERIVIDLDHPHPVWTGYPDTDPDAHSLGLTARHLAYIIYTSGSTGMPKGVAMPHRNLINLLCWQKGVLPKPGRTLQFSALGFDVAFQEIFSTLTGGSTLVLLREALRQNLPALVDWLSRQSIERLFLPYVALNNLSELWSQQTSALQDLITAGERLQITPAIRRLLAQHPQARLHNHYGPTESHVVSAHMLDNQTETWEDLPPIGRPIANTRIYLLDAHGQPVPLGAVGELYIGGVGVARGYLHRPELTAERFLPNPFVADPDARMYRTGDLARYLPDGNLLFLGRNDHQIKLRGFRIELGEIEAHLTEHAAVREAVVLALGDDADKRLIAYVVPAARTARDDDADIVDESNQFAATLRAHLTTRLPDYMVPAAFVILDALPLTPNGKLDRRALPSPGDDAFARHVYEAPQGEIETTLATIWQELLKVERVGRHDHFFELGGHSLLAVRLLSRLAATFKIELPLAELFTHPTVSALAAVIVQYQATHAAHLIPITPTSRDGALPLSFAQQRLWFLAQLKDVSATYHIPAALRLRGTLDTLALRRAFDALFTRHEALRTVFVAVEGQPHVELLPARQSFPLVEYDLQGHADPSAALAQLSREEALAPFDLTHGPLIRARLLRLAGSDHVLLITQHHIVSDGWSLGVLVNELSALYGAFTRGQSDPLAPLAIQYPDYATWQRQWFTEEQLAGQLDFWHRSLADAPVLLDVPTDRPRSASPSYVGASVPIQVDADLTRALKQLSQQHGTTLFMTLTAAWAAVLARLSGQNDLVIGTPSANRGRREIESLVGFFVNALALRIDLSGDPSVAALLERVRTVTLAAQDHQDVPFEQVVERVNPPRRLEHAPLFQIWFAWHSNDQGTFDLPGLQVESMPTAFDRIKFDLELSLSEVGDSILGNLRYATDLFDASTIERHRGYLLTLLKAMVEHVDQPIARINVLAPEERTLLLDTWNQTDTSYPADRCIHQLFEAQVLRDPTATALVFEDRSLSYGELNTQANRLAHYLIEQGVRPDDRIAICVERSFSMITGLLAILKAGGAYVPLDPAYPGARLVQVLADANPPIVLTDAFGRAVLGEEPLRERIVIDLDHPHPVWTGYPDTDPDAHALGLTARHLAYIIYTSGSTGMPKGVMIEHRHIVDRLTWTQSTYGLTWQDTTLLKTSSGFDVSIRECLWPLIAGAKLIIAAHNKQADSDYFLQLAINNNVTVLNFVPSMMSIFIQNREIARLANLSRVICGGEKLPLALAKEIKNVLPNIILNNHYGPTETTINALMYQLDWHETDSPPIGRPTANTRLYLLDAHGQPVPLGAVGELYIGGVGVARGYLHRPELTAERFLPNPFVADPDARMYRTGDLARYLPDGNLLFLGRNDHQVKLRGFRIELGEIEAHLSEHTAVREAVVLALGDDADKRLIAYVVPTAHSIRDDDHDAADALNNLAATLRAHLEARLPDYMVPASFVILDALPLTPNGKLDRQTLLTLDNNAFVHDAYEAPQGEIEIALATIWQELLGIERVGRDDRFFELGGTSLLAIKLHRKINDCIRSNVSLTDVFTYPTINAFARFLSPEANIQKESVEPPPTVSTSQDIAIVGMACRFPDAHNADAFWANLAGGAETIRFYTREELQAIGMDPALTSRTNFVPARSLLDGVEYFDADYFGFTPREAELTDPQQRILLECAHEALEMAGYGDAANSRSVGVYVGIGESVYAFSHLMPQIDAFANLGTGMMYANSKDHAATRISYKLNLSGPSVSVNTACSTSLVALHQACHCLLSGESQMALAGAASITEFGPGGYLYQEGGIQSPDGHCRVFDLNSQGTRKGNGAGLVLLKRLDLALADGDMIHAVIKGSAINNDGSDKVGYTAPSVTGQAQVIAQAYRNAGISPATIQYVETHGTGTVLGDPIEIRALSQVFVKAEAKRCAIGSVKPNIGHLDAAAGVAGLIKTVAALKNRQLPPTINYEQPNPEIDFANSPFYVNTQLRDWPAGHGPRRAGISSFGIGGTNVHVVLEEAPMVATESVLRKVQLLVLSARSTAALQVASDQLAARLSKNDGTSLADVAFTLQAGRTRHAYRRVIVCETAAEAITKLASPPIGVEKMSDQASSMIWMFPGQGTQHVNMGRSLYATEPLFRELLDTCAERLRDALGLDLREVLYPSEGGFADAERRLRQTWLAQPALFAVEYSLARLLQSYGLQPEAMIGHSLGEYVAACLAGVFSLDDALRLVAARGRLMQGMVEGRMLSVLEDEECLRARLSDSELSVAALNGGGQCVVSGPIEAIEVLRELLRAERIESREIETSHAFHSGMMEPMLAPWRAVVKSVKLNVPKIPYVSNLSGNFIRAEEAMDAEYWVKHLRETVLFGKGLDVLLSPNASLKEARVLVEVGPGQALSGLARRRSHRRSGCVVPMLERAAAKMDDARAFHQGVGQLWLLGAQINWSEYHGDKRRRVPLPTYPFERQRFWVEAPRNNYLAMSRAVHSTSDLSARIEERIDLLQPESAGMQLYVRSSNENYVPPSDAIERQLVGIWQELLGFDGIGIRDEFFELGGDSLLAVRLFNRVHEVFSTTISEFSMRDFFEQPTIEAGAKKIRSALTMASLLEKQQEIYQKQQSVEEGIF